MTGPIGGVVYLDQVGPTGVTVREWFAGLALQGMLANSQVLLTNADVVDSAFQLADRMLAERDK
jgi:hypothetical protein